MRRTLLALTCLALSFTLVSGAGLPTSTDPDRIEEDWKVVVAEPAPGIHCPQIFTSMSPGGDDSSPNMVFTVNYRDQPTFHAGGLQVQAWQGKVLKANSDQGTALCGTNDETITWTQRMTLSEGNLNLKVLSGQSTTWGQFGVADSDLTVSTPCSLSSLAGYSADDSVSKSTVSYGANRVTSMTLVEVRTYQGDTLLSTDTKVRNVVGD